MAIKPEGGGDKALMAPPFREELFFAASLAKAAHWNLKHSTLKHKLQVQAWP